MPALRALALLGFLVGTAMGVVGIASDLRELTFAGFAIFGVGAALGLLLHRLDPNFKDR
jgi:hypothetical protein